MHCYRCWECVNYRRRSFHRGGVVLAALRQRGSAIARSSCARRRIASGSAKTKEDKPFSVKYRSRFPTLSMRVLFCGIFAEETLVCGTGRCRIFSAGRGIGSATIVLSVLWPEEPVAQLLVCTSGVAASRTVGKLHHAHDPLRTA